MQKIELARVAGPFDQIPMHKFRYRHSNFLHIGIVDKKDGGWRFIRYLSFHERIVLMMSLTKIIARFIKHRLIKFLK